jgi:hypothetical protein
MIPAKYFTANKPSVPPISTQTMDDPETLVALVTNTTIRLPETERK